MKTSSLVSVSITHSDALRLARLGGALVGRLFGRPDVVIGIERSGRSVAIAFAEGSGSETTLFVKQQRPSSRGWRGSLRSVVRRTTPRLLRRTYKQLFFKSAVQIDRLKRSSSRLDDPSTRERLLGAIPTDRGCIVAVVDDAIDSGITMQTLVDTIEAMHPEHVVIPFALTSTAGVCVHDRQLNLFEDIVEFVEGDLAELAEERARSLLEAIRPQRPTDGILRRNSSSNNGEGESHKSSISLYLDLDGTLVSNSFRDALQTLYPLLTTAEKCRYVQLRARKVLRLIGHDGLKRGIDALIRGLDDARRLEFEQNLALMLRRHARGPLLAVARAPHVRSRIVTAALSSYARAVEEAFGIEVLCSSGFASDGSTWNEIQTHGKFAAILADRSARQPGHGPTLMLGNTETDALSAGEGLDVQMVPSWDRSGLVTLLGAESWWQRRNNGSSRS